MGNIHVILLFCVKGMVIWNYDYFIHCKHYKRILYTLTRKRKLQHTLCKLVNTWLWATPSLYQTRYPLKSWIITRVSWRESVSLCIDLYGTNNLVPWLFGYSWNGSFGVTNVINGSDAWRMSYRAIRHFSMAIINHNLVLTIRLVYEHIYNFT